MYRIKTAVALIIGYAMVAGQAEAAGWTDTVTIKGFASVNYERSNAAEPFNGEENVGIDDQGSLSGTRMGLNINARINERLRFASQLFASKDAEFAVNVDWAFGVLTLTDQLDLRTGKIKFPVGLVNEYVDVGYVTPWIQAPAVIYSELGAPNGPQMTRESFTGISLLGQQAIAGDWLLEADLFGGEIDLDGISVRELSGITLRADWDDTVQFQLSSYEGTMRGTGTVMGGAMEGVKHEGVLYGAKADWNDVIFYAERGDITMGDITAMKATSWYTTVGYRIGKLLPHLTYQNYEQGEVDDEQTITTLGLRWDFMPGVALKVELGQIKTDKGNGLFPQGSSPADTVNTTGFGLDMVF